MTLLFVLMVLFQIKHYLLDFRFQPPYMWQNKGTLWHPGGLLHSGLHAYATCLMLSFVVGFWTFPLAALEFVIHYAIDYWKMNRNKDKGWACNTHPEFWYLTGQDQLIHQLTYCLLLLAVTILG